MTTYPTPYRTTEAYLSGGICGAMWCPFGVLGGKPVRVNLRGPWGIMGRFTEPASFRDALDSLLALEGGDFSDAKFTADTRITVIRKRYEKPGVYTVHVWERELAQLPGCADLIHDEAFTGDFLG